MNEYQSKCPECGAKDYFEPGEEVLCISCDTVVVLEKVEVKG